MKILTISTILAVAVLSFASCNKQYDTEVSDSQTNNNNNGSGGAGGSGFSWTGTAPMSAKINGIPFLANEIYVSEAAGVYYNILGQENDAAILSVSIPFNAKAGQVFSMPTPAASSCVLPPNLALISTTGKLKIVTNNSTTIEGYFWADERDPNGLSDTTVHVTEGYFKVDKP
jgi:hypothetical protein